MTESAYKIGVGRFLSARERQRRAKTPRRSSFEMGLVHDAYVKGKIDVDELEAEVERVLRGETPMVNRLSNRLGPPPFQTESLEA